VRLGLTMRVVRETRYAEQRDALAQDWSAFMQAALPECTWLAIPNIGPASVDYFDAWGLHGLILTGGEDGSAGERAETETALLRMALQRKLPVFGVCRGLQRLQTHFGGELALCSRNGHVGRRHPVWFNPIGSGLGIGAAQREVNSFHRWGIAAEHLAAPLSAFALTDGWVEGAWSEDLRLAGVMWHPERERPVHAGDVLLMRHFFALPEVNGSCLGL
jgi:N5-(cytidine 5'-diphosphoramidyl)-L-glutamine hydrolase